MIEKLKKKIFSTVYFLFVTVLLFAQDVPEKPFPPRLVNDFAGLLKPEEINSLERKLVNFDDTTSTQIAIVTVSDLKGYDKADYAQRIGEKWGVGRKGFDNGIVILVKPKTAYSQGEVFIATGYGLEGAIPDLVCADIIDNEILPAFRQGDYYGGLDKATDVLMALASGEFSADEYHRQIRGDLKIIPLVVLIIIVVVIFSLFSSGRSNHQHFSGRRNDLPLWILLGMMGSGRGSHRGSWGDFSGGGGGFGGFGGGSFGGGGAGGSW